MDQPTSVYQLYACLGWDPYEFLDCRFFRNLSRTRWNHAMILQHEPGHLTTLIQVISIATWKERDCFQVWSLSTWEKKYFVMALFYIRISSYHFTPTSWINTLRDGMYSLGNVRFHIFNERFDSKVSMSDGIFLFLSLRLELYVDDVTRIGGADNQSMASLIDSNLFGSLFAF
jgi:hypothetical protein